MTGAVRDLGGWRARLCLVLAAMLVSPPVSAAPAVAQRHIYVIYDVSLSYQFDHNVTWDADHDAIIDTIKSIGSSINDDDYFSFLPMDGRVRYDCERSEREDYGRGFELFGAGIYIHDDEDGDTNMGWGDWHRIWSGHVDNFRRSVRAAKFSSWTQKTDIRGALYRAAYLFRKFPARKNVLLIFSDLDDDPVDLNSGAGLCGSLDLTNVEVHVVDFGEELSSYVKNKSSRPTASQRLNCFAALLRRAHVSQYELDKPNEIFSLLAGYAQSGPRRYLTAGPCPSVPPPRSLSAR